MAKKEPAAPTLEVPVGRRLAAVLTVAWRARRPVLLEGPTGVGKSELVQHVAASLGVQCVVLDLSLLEPPDLVGLPVLDGGFTRYAPPAFLPQDGCGILMLEELNRAERYIQQPALQLLTARRLHEYQLPDGWSCCAAINPEAGEYQVTPLDPALKARCLHVKVRADRASWLAWARARGLHQAVVELAQAHDHVLEGIPPRTWTYVSEVLQALSPLELEDDTLLRDLLGGYLPSSWVTVLLSEKARWALASGPNTDQLLGRYHTDGALSKTVRGWAVAGLTDRLAQLAERVQAVIEGPSLGLLLDRGVFELQAFDALLRDLPGDHRERLQRAFGRNALASRCLPVKAQDVLRGYPNSGAWRVVSDWVKDPIGAHKLGALATALAVSVDIAQDVNALRRDTNAAAGLGAFLDQLQALRDPGVELARPLVESLRRRDVRPAEPRR
ncbi:MAG: AAA family ATPase [Deltaproteobacteria bacterium]|nr:AAA family ATPase [Deltaproteobacteria bacterium]